MSAGHGGMWNFNEVKSKAEEISKWKNEYDKLVWLLAEADLKLELGSQPPEDRIKSRAETIAKQHPTMQELHWFLAEKILALSEKKG